MIITFTGHRPDKITNPIETKKLLGATMLLNGINFKEDKFRVGGCPGFDTIALELLLEQEVPLSNIELMVPFIGFERYAGKSHMEENMKVFNFNRSLTQRGLKITECGGKDGSFGQKCYKRNECLCRGADIIFSNWDGSDGGTGNTIGIAKRMKLKICIIGE